MNIRPQDLLSHEPTLWFRRHQLFWFRRTRSIALFRSKMRKMYMNLKIFFQIFFKFFFWWVLLHCTGFARLGGRLRVHQVFVCSDRRCGRLTWIWWVLHHCTGLARLVGGRLRVHRAFVCSDRRCGRLTWRPSWRRLPRIFPGKKPKKILRTHSLAIGYEPIRRLLRTHSLAIFRIFEETEDT